MTKGFALNHDKSSQNVSLKYFFCTKPQAKMDFLNKTYVEALEVFFFFFFFYQFSQPTITLTLSLLGKIQWTF